MYKVYRDGGSIIRPLFFEFPEDGNTFNENTIDSTFFLGDALKVSPVLKAGVKNGDKFQSYFPKGEWADLNNQTLKVSSNGQNIDLESSFTSTNVHLRPGKIVPYQNPAQVGKTKDFEAKPITFLVNQDESHYADGYTLVDDGVSSTTWDKQAFTFWKIKYSVKNINSWIEYGDSEYVPQEGNKADQLEEVRILQAENLADTDFACYIGKDMIPHEITHTYNKYSKILSLKPVGQTTVSFKDIAAIKFGNSQKEPNFCLTSLYSYSVDKDFTINNNT